MSVLEAVRYGFVWCGSCGTIERRETEIEPLPFCRSCRTWMEPMLCEHGKCEAEAEVKTAGGYYCRIHSAGRI